MQIPGAGLGSNIRQAEKERIPQLRRAGMTIREIMSETGRSLGYVHKLIREHEAMCRAVTKNERSFLSFTFSWHRANCSQNNCFAKCVYA